MRSGGSFANLGRLPEEDRNATVFSVGGEEIRISDCLETLTAKMIRKAPALDDSVQVVRFLKQHVVSDVLMLRATLTWG